MATGITIDEVTNTLDDIQGTEKIPVSSGISEPEVVTTGDLKNYINDGMQEEISDLSTIRSGASAGATAYQKPPSGIPSTDLASAVQTSLGKADTALQSFTETDPTVPSWAKSSSKPSYNYSEISGTPTLANVATSGSYNDLTNKPTIPDAQIQSDWNQSNTSAKDYIKNKPTIPVVPSNVSAFTNDAGYITTESDPTVPSWAKQSSKPSYAVGEISGAQETLVSGTNIKTINGNSVLGSGNISIQGGDANVIESISFNGSSVPVDNNKNAAITYTAPVTSVNGNTGAVSLSIPTESTVSGWGFTKNAGTITGVTMNGASKGTSGVVDLGTVITAHQDISGKADKVTSATNGNFAALDSNGNLTDSGHKHSDYLTSHQDLSNYVQKSNTTGLLKNDGSVDTNTYLTSAPVTSVNGQTGAVSLSIPTIPSNVSAFTNDAGYTTNTGTVTSTGGTVAVNNIQVVSALPASPDANTLYLIPES